VSGSRPRPGPSATAVRPSARARTTATASSPMAPEAISGRISVMLSTRSPATIGCWLAATPTVTRPAPVRRAARAASAAAPGLPAPPADPHQVSIGALVCLAWSLGKEPLGIGPLGEERGGTPLHLRVGNAEGYYLDAAGQRGAGAGHQTALEAREGRRQ